MTARNMAIEVMTTAVKGELANALPRSAHVGNGQQQQQQQQQQYGLAPGGLPPGTYEPT
jgi:hypothetical protein